MNNIRVLIIDDDAELRFNLKLYLEDEGLVCTQAHSAEEALDIIKSEKFDIAIVDLRLPGKNGEEFVIESVPTKRIGKYLIHTGSLDYETSETLTKLGVTNNNILFKPLNDMEELVTKIKQILKVK
jgi:DNA-binding response OmpR family regulator